jgi:hypothetical protein
VSRGYRAKETKQLIDRIMAACPGAAISATTRGHLKVTGPYGTAIIPPKPGNNPLASGEAKSKLARYAGIHLAA